MDSEVSASGTRGDVEAGISEVPGVELVRVRRKFSSYACCEGVNAWVGSESDDDMVFKVAGWLRSGDRERRPWEAVAKSDVRGRGGE